MCEPVPAALPHLPVGPTTDRERIHARAEQDEQGRQHRERDQPGERPHEPAGKPHRAHEPEREHGQRRDRDAHRHRAERDRPPGRRERRAHGLDARPTPGELLAVAGDEQQAVVDPEPETRAGDDVQRVRGDRRRPVEQAKQEQRAEDRQCAAQERQQRRDHAPEHPESEQEQDREGELLRVGEVALHLPVDLGDGERAPAHGGPADVRQPLLHAVGCVPPEPLRHARPRIGEDDRLPPVAREERTSHDRKDGLRPDQLRDSRQPCSGRIADEHEHLRRRGQARRLFDRLLRAEALAALRDEVVRPAPEQVRRLQAEHGGDHRQSADDREEAPRAARRELGEHVHGGHSLRAAKRRDP